MNRIIAFLTLCLLFGPKSNGREERKSAGRIGDLLITFVSIEERENQQPKGDRRLVVVRVRAENIGKQALCTSFRATLKATFGLQYDGWASRNSLRIREMLPGETAEGEYEFPLKNGVEPLQFVLKSSSETQTCTPGRDSLSATWHIGNEVKFDLTKLADASSQEDTPQDSRPSNTPGVRVFLTGTKEGAGQVTAMKAFRDHCPRVQITTEKERANYVVQLTPASLKRSKNLVVVTNRAGDVIHSGTTFRLGNAAKDACTAIYSDVSAKPKGSSVKPIQQ